MPPKALGGDWLPSSLDVGKAVRTPGPMPSLGLIPVPLNDALKLDSLTVSSRPAVFEE